MEVINKIDNLVYKKYEELEGFQEDLKELSKQEYEKLKNSILINGIIAPVYVWNNKILDGHQRVKVLKQLKLSGVDIPEEIPCVEIVAKSEKQAKKFLLQYVSQHGKITDEGLYSYLHNSTLIKDYFDIKQEIDLPGFNMDMFEKGYITDFTKEDLEKAQFAEDKEKEVDENIETDYECPKCGHKFS